MALIVIFVSLRQKHGHTIDSDVVSSESDSGRPEVTPAWVTVRVQAYGCPALVTVRVIHCHDVFVISELQADFNKYW